jgi:hypothetical protein
MRLSDDDDDDGDGYDDDGLMRPCDGVDATAY